MTQHELVLEWVKEHGFIDPAHKGGVIYKGVMFGSETTKRCRELRKKGVLDDFKDGKFVCFRLKTAPEPQNCPLSPVTEQKGINTQVALFEVKLKPKSPYDY